jgi:hypothetical protein
MATRQQMTRNHLSRAMFFDKLRAFDQDFRLVSLRPRNAFGSGEQNVGPGLFLKSLDPQIGEFISERREALKNA